MDARFGKRVEIEGRANFLLLRVFFFLYSRILIKDFSFQYYYFYGIIVRSKLCKFVKIVIQKSLIE